MAQLPVEQEKKQLKRGEPHTKETADEKIKRWTQNTNIAKNSDKAAKLLQKQQK